MFTALLISGSLAHAAGSAYLTTDPAGARVLVDGADVGMTTPATVDGLSAGSHTLTAVGDCTRGEVTVKVVDGATTRVAVPLAVAGGTLAFQPDPAAAQISVDGQRLEDPTIPLSVGCGEHRVSASLPGFHPALLTLQVDLGDQLVLPIALESIGYGAVELNLRPEGAALKLDGYALTTTLDQVAAGPHVLAAELDGYAPGQVQFVLEAGQTLPLDLRLDRLPPERRRGPRLVGAGLSVVGAGALVFSGLEFAAARSEYLTYLDDVDAVEAGDEPEKTATSQYTGSVVPHRNKMLISGSLGALALATGVTLVVAF